MSAPPTAQARGATRLLWASLAAKAAALQAASDAIPTASLRDVRRCTSAGRTRAMTTTLGAMSEPPLYREKRAALWRVLVPADAMVVVDGLGFGICGIGGWSRRSFGLGFTLHALGRFYDRTGFTGDAEAAMLQAHDALLALRPDEGEAAFLLHTITVPAGPGLFVVEPQPARDDGLRAIARTWVSHGQTWPDQEAEAAAWAQIIAADAGRAAA